MGNRSWLVIALLPFVAACAQSESAESTTTVAPAASTTAIVTTSTTSQVTTTVGATTTTVEEIDVRFEGGQVDGPERFSFTVGDEVSIWVLSDTDEEVHVHGYDVMFPVIAGVPVEVSLTADVPGIFEVELEESATPLFELEVTP